MNKMKYAKRQYHKASRQFAKKEANGYPNANAYSLTRWISELQYRGT